MLFFLKKKREIKLTIGKGTGTSWMVQNRALLAAAVVLVVVAHLLFFCFFAILKSINVYGFLFC